MKVTRSAALFAAVILSGVASAQTEPKIEMKEAEPKPPVHQAQGNGQEPEGYVLVEERVVTELQASPLMMMENAKRQFHDKNFGASASDLRSAAAMLRIEAKRTSQADKATLETSAKDLEKLANNVQDQKVKSEMDLDRGLAEASQAKAAHHHLLAAKEWAAKEYRRAGHDLKAAADATERSAEWSGGELSRGGKDIIAGAREVSGKLIAGTGWATAEVGKAIDSLGTEVQKLGHKVEPSKTAH